MVEFLKTACNRDCPDACTLVVTVDDGRAVRLQGDREDPVTRGFLCERTNRFLHRQYRSDRFTTPMIRCEGKLQPIGWDEALDLAAEKLRTIKDESGPGAILNYRSGGSLGLLKHCADALFNAFGPTCVKHGDVCSGAGETAQLDDFGISESHDLFDLLNSKTIVLWGKNPHTSGVHLIPVLRDAKAKGARIVGIDPVRTKAAQLCDSFHMPRPGSDFSVAMGVARRLYDRDLIDPSHVDWCENADAFRELVHRRTVAEWAAEADLEESAVAEIGDLYGDGPSALLVGWGLGRRRNGYRTTRALDALGAVAGNLGVSGGGVSYYFGRRLPFDATLGMEWREPPRTFSEPRLGPELLAADPAVRMVWVTAGNPVSMLPESLSVRRALEKTEFVVVVDTHPTDTTDVADLVLPTLTLLEDDDLLGAYGNHYLRVSRPTLAPPGEARHELAIWQGLAERLGLGDLLAGTPRDIKRRFMTHLEAADVHLEDLENAPVRNPLAADVLFADRVFPRPGGKVNLLTEEAVSLREDEPGFPLRLLAVSTPKAQSSQWCTDVPEGPATVRVHPRAAGGFADGAEAVLESSVGTLPVRVRHDDGVHPTVALMDKGGMLRDGRGVNALVAAEHTDGGFGAVYYDQPVRLVATSS